MTQTDTQAAETTAPLDSGGFNPDFEEGDFTRVDLTPYRQVLARMKRGVTATITVPTGTLNDKGRGETEVGHERNFRKAALEAGHGMKAGHTHMPNGTTRLRFSIGEKRKFSEAAAKARNASLAKSRQEKAVKSLMVEHPDWSNEQAVKHYRTELAKRKAAQAPPAS